MAKINRKTYTDAEKALYIAEFQRLHKGGSRTYESIARELGVHVSSYYSWVAAGIKPISAPVQAPPAVKANTIYPPAERKRLVSEVERHRANGQSVVSACQLAGIGVKSYRSWSRQQEVLPLREVSVTALVPATSVSPVALTVVAPGGYRVEGLNIEVAARLLRALSC